MIEKEWHWHVKTFVVILVCLSIFIVNFLTYFSQKIFISFLYLFSLLYFTTGLNVPSFAINCKGYFLLEFCMLTITINYKYEI